ncbi:hypothetical protein CEN40_08900 [Fischerella thermalis CCMEE 5205]|nr:hypothetical protein CEN40_08900 [Fischerella thermalis CCMEE 5205]
MRLQKFTDWEKSRTKKTLKNTIATPTLIAKRGICFFCIRLQLRDLQKIKCPTLSNIFQISPRIDERSAPRRNARAGHFITWKGLRLD